MANADIIGDLGTINNATTICVDLGSLIFGVFGALISVLGLIRMILALARK